MRNPHHIYMCFSALATVVVDYDFRLLENNRDKEKSIARLSAPLRIGTYFYESCEFTDDSGAP